MHEIFQEHHGKFWMIIFPDNCTILLAVIFCFRSQVVWESKINYTLQTSLYVIFQLLKIYLFHLLYIWHHPTFMGLTFKWYSIYLVCTGNYVYGIIQHTLYNILLYFIVRESFSLAVMCKTCLYWCKSNVKCSEKFLIYITYTAQKNPPKNQW